MFGKKINFEEYEFIDLSKTEVENFSDSELADMCDATLEILSATKGKVKKTPMNLGLAAGYLGVHGGEFVHVNGLTAKWKKGECSKQACKVLKKVFSTAKFYYLVKNLLSAAVKKENGYEILPPQLAKKK